MSITVHHDIGFLLFLYAEPENMWAVVGQQIKNPDMSWHIYPMTVKALFQYPFQPQVGGCVETYYSCPSDLRPLHFKTFIYFKREVFNLQEIHVYTSQKWHFVTVILRPYIK